MAMRVMVLLVFLLLVYSNNAMISTADKTKCQDQAGEKKSAVIMKSNSTESSSPPPSKLQHHVNTSNVAILQEKMSLYIEEQSVPNWGVQTLLKSISDQHMVPILRTIPPYKSLPLLAKMSFNGQEKEDQLIYQRFFNEETLRCHQFGNKLFESGAYEGIKLSNTYFFEKRFNLSTILVEAAEDNWSILVQNVPKQRPHSDYHHAALCPIGVHSICMQVGEYRTMHSVNLTTMRKSIERNSGGDTGNATATKTDIATTTTTGCTNSIPCFDFDESIHYAFFSLDIEGFEMEFLRMRRVVADVFLIEFVQWVEAVKDVITAVELIAYMAEQGYYLYEETIGFRNLVFLSKELVNDCFRNFKWD